jgi:hypothetical protein
VLLRNEVWIWKFTKVWKQEKALWRFQEIQELLWSFKENRSFQELSRLSLSFKFPKADWVSLEQFNLQYYSVYEKSSFIPPQSLINLLIFADKMTESPENFHFLIFKNPIVANIHTSVKLPWLAANPPCYKSATNQLSRSKFDCRPKPAYSFVILTFVKLACSECLR